MGRKDPSRKAPKRAPSKPVIDDELVELARVIDEQRLDKNAAGWFSVPWRDGWNAVNLALDASQRAYRSSDPNEVPEWALFLGRLIRDRELSSQAYLTADMFIESRQVAAFARAALRCYQLLVSRSDAGGDGYNRILFPLFDAQEPEAHEGTIRYWRAQDALGGFVDERRRAAFNTAWNRGLYKVAYAV